MRRGPIASIALTPANHAGQQRTTDAKMGEDHQAMHRGYLRLNRFQFAGGATGQATVCCSAAKRRSKSRSLGARRMARWYRCRHEPPAARTRSIQSLLPYDSRLVSRSVPVFPQDQSAINYWRSRYKRQLSKAFSKTLAQSAREKRRGRHDCKGLQH
jgi:hypothetical protein